MARVFHLKKILIVDYVVGGGHIEEPLPQERLAEGYAILRACIEQCSLKGYEVATLIDERLLQYIRISPIHRYKSIGNYEDFLNGLKEFSDDVDYCLTLAPETKGILRDLSVIMQNANSVYLGSNPEAIKLAADKNKTMNLAKELGMNIPATIPVSLSSSYNDILDKIKFLGFPLIVKPIDGVGCQGLTKVQNPREIEYALQSARYHSSREEVLAQEFIEGVPISTSLIANENTIIPLSINRQNLRMESGSNPGHYLGGEVPYDIQKYREKIMDLSIELVQHMDLQGFVGVDLIVGKEGVFVIEVNPRITVPFVGIRSIAKENIIQLLIDVMDNGSNIPSKIHLKGYTSFSKISVPSSIAQQTKFEKVAVLDGVISPPFPVTTNSHSSSFLMGIGTSITSARKDFQRVKNELLENLSS
ncbi:MAG: ATP-grasp domain-containing protein [Candidatus Heimdallarchaeota archaeon]|nr:ATP-grasp domain-containing protein [Candidatus Heimdallarchaeota archaeon]